MAAETGDLTFELAKRVQPKGQVYAITTNGLTLSRAGDVVLQLKSLYHDGTDHVVMSPLECMQRLAALVACRSTPIPLSGQRRAFDRFQLA